MIPVRVQFRRLTYCGTPGWTYTVLAAQGELRILASGTWSAGPRREVEALYRDEARRRGWVDAETRAERMRGVA